jgi:hypothetical protein
MIAKSGIGGFTGRLFVEALYDSGMTLQGIDKALEFVASLADAKPVRQRCLGNAPAASWVNVARLAGAAFCRCDVGVRSSGCGR